MKILAIDLTEQKGHIQLNKTFLDILNLKYDITFLSSKTYVEKINFKNNILLPDKLFQFKSKYEFVLKQIKLIRYIKKKYLNNSYDRIIILGFENISFSLAWRNVKIPTFTILHNNLTRGKLSMYFFNKISLNVSHIALEEFIKKYLTIKVNNKIFFLPHPLNQNILNLQNENREKGLIFCPSASSSLEEINSFADFINKQSYFRLVAKGPKEYSKQNVIVKKYFNNYEELMSKCEFVFIPFKYDYRVSGIFYEAMTMGKTVITLKTAGKFMIEMAKIYPQCVKLINEYSEIFSFSENESKCCFEINIFINKHDNLNISRILNKILN